MHNVSPKWPTMKIFHIKSCRYSFDFWPVFVFHLQCRRGCVQWQHLWDVSGMMRPELKTLKLRFWTSWTGPKRYVHRYLKSMKVHAIEIGYVGWRKKIHTCIHMYHIYKTYHINKINIIHTRVYAVCVIESSSADCLLCRWWVENLGLGFLFSAPLTRDRK